MEQVAFFDFCETLTDFQTADAFVHFVRKKHGNRKMSFRNKIVAFLSKTYILLIIDKIFHCAANKRMVLWQLKGLSQTDVESYAHEYYNDMLVPHSIYAIQDKLDQLRKEGYRIVIVSGGYDVYLNYYANANGIKPEDVISSKIQFKDGICTGKMEGLDCMGINKTILMNAAFDKNSIKSVSFSDSKSDLPMLKWTNSGYVISKNLSQSWAQENELNEIIWRTSKR